MLIEGCRVQSGSNRRLRWSRGSVELVELTLLGFGLGEEAPAVKAKGGLPGVRSLA